MATTKIVIINGLGGCGKSTFTAKCKAYCELHRPDTDVNELSTVDYVKRVAGMVGWTGGKTAKDRVFLSDLKRAFEKWNNMPVRFVFMTIKEIMADKEHNHIIFVNSREPKDIEYMRKKADKMGISFSTLQVVKPDIVVNEVPDLIEGIETMEYDYVINNYGDLNDLTNLAASFVEELMK